MRLFIVTAITIEMEPAIERVDEGLERLNKNVKEMKVYVDEIKEKPLKEDGKSCFSQVSNRS